MERNLEYFEKRFKSAVEAKPLFINIVTMEPHETIVSIVNVCRQNGWKSYYWDQIQLLSFDLKQRVLADVGKILDMVTNKEVGPGVIIAHRKAVDPNVILISLLYDVNAVANPIVLLSSHAESDSHLKAYSITIEYPLPTKEEIKKIIGEQIVRTINDGIIPVQMTDEAAEIALGLTSAEIKNAVSQIVAEVDESKIMNKKKKVIKVGYEEMKVMKEEIIRQESLISLEQPVPMSQVGGLDRVKDWLAVRKIAFESPKLEKPKGLLLLGIPGTGKSLCAKAIADYLNLPLVKFDISALFSKYVGESEARVREALRRVDAISRCVLWVDEIEKAIMGHRSQGDSGTTSRVVSTLLTWMQERDTVNKAIFVVATANIIEQLPEYLIRKGRFDEIFFVDIPSYSEAIDIFRIHAEKRGIEFDPDIIARHYAGIYGKYVGAEIEEICKNATYIAANERKKPNTWHIVQAAKDIVPMAETHKEQIERLRESIRRYNIKPASSASDDKISFEWQKNVGRSKN